MDGSACSARGAACANRPRRPRPARACHTFNLSTWDFSIKDAPTVGAVFVQIRVKARAGRERERVVDVVCETERDSVRNRFRILASGNLSGRLARPTDGHLVLTRPASRACDRCTIEG